MPLNHYVVRPMNRRERNEMHKDDAYFLDLAYKNKLNYYYIHNDTMYVAGTDNLQDVYDDITKVPKWGYITDSARYNMVKPVLDKHPQIKKLVGHSLSGIVALRLQKEMPERDFEVTTYGAPVFGYWSGKNTRYKHQFDPISMFDMGAKITPIASVNPLTLHSYKGYTYDFKKHSIQPANTETVVPKLFNPVQTDNTYRIY